MCGIAGIITDESLRDLHGALQRMVRAQAHRGPDDEGVITLPPDSAYRTPYVALGSRRLAIIDLSPAGHQPISNEDGMVWVTYNGEIYNFMDIRDELIKRGYRFRSNTDSEVLVHGYEEWGIEGLLRRLRGMFAFAIWDQKNRRLFVARDRLGKKPLYYTWGGRTFLFASELKSLLASGLVERCLNPAGIVAYLSLGSVPAPLTMIDGVEALPPGCYLTLQDGTPELKRYWHLSFNEAPNLTEDEVIERLRPLLQEAVQLRLVSDVPVGAFLSGGIDSSAIVALMREATGGTIRTFSITFKEKEFSEGSFAKLVAEHFETEHTEYKVTADEVLCEFPKVIWAMDQPTIDGVNTYFVSKVTRDSGTIVALSGVGGDELFGGYSSFQRVPRLYHLSLAAHAVPGCGRALEKMLGAVARHGRLHKLRALFQHPASPEMSYLAVRGLYLGDELKALVNPDLLEHGSRLFTPLSYLQAITADHYGLCLPNTVSLLELRTYMHNQLLRDTDVMSMAHALEARVPFLDHVLVEFLASVPTKYKFTATPKALLMNALKSKLPQSVIERPKGGFTFPFERWLAGPWNAWLEDILNGLNTEIFNPQEVRSLRHRFIKGNMHWSRIWAVAVLQAWSDMFLDSPVQIQR
jgi:asparagine synthase (glutamine-hydrolysing)